jgi:hypothetical protein
MVGIAPIGVRVHFRDPERKLGDLHVRALCPSQRGGRAGAQDPPSHRQQGKTLLRDPDHSKQNRNTLLRDPDLCKKFCSKCPAGSGSALFTGNFLSR